jgi:hypothetical protein
MMNCHKPTADRSFGRWFVFLVLLLSFAGGAQGQIFTDWTTVDTTNRFASGTLGSTSATFTWDSAGTVNAFWPSLDYPGGFPHPPFTPALTTSDALEFQGYLSAPHYTISFGVPVLNPILQLKSLASTLDFGSATLTEISSDGLWTVDAHRVVGADGTSDTAGTIQFLGAYSSLSFTASYSGAYDGIDLQVGATAVPESAASATLLGAAALGLVLACRRRRRV